MLYCELLQSIEKGDIVELKGGKTRLALGKVKGGLLRVKTISGGELLIDSTEIINVYK